MSKIELIFFKTKVDIKRKCNEYITDKAILCYKYYHKSKELHYICEIDGFSNNQDSFIENQNGYIYEINNKLYFIINKGKEMEKITSFLETHMTTIFNDFKKEEWCDLRENGLDTSHYTNISKQQSYLLKYFPAYFTEYYHAYSKLFKILKKDNINIISIGCGSGIDYYALEHYKRVKNTKLNYTYLGVDIVEWDYKPSGINFLNTPISKLDEKTLKNVDVIVFPKILTELSDKEINDFATKILKYNTSKELYFVNSYITNDATDNTKIDGINKFEIVCKKLKNNGFNLVNDECATYHRFINQKGISNTHSFFNYPDDIINATKILPEVCIDLNESEEKCKSCDIGFSPILTAKYIAFQVLKFVKK